MNKYTPESSEVTTLAIKLDKYINLRRIGSKLFEREADILSCNLIASALEAAYQAGKAEASNDLDKNSN